MAEKIDTNSVTYGQQLEMSRQSKFITEPQNILLINLETPEDQLEKSISPRQRSFNPHLATGEHGSLYCFKATPLSGIPDGLPSDNPVFLAPSMQSDICIDQIRGDIYTYGQASKLFV